MTNLTERLSPQKHSSYQTGEKVKLWMAHILPVAILVLALWLPFGLSLTGLIEEWGVLGLFTTFGQFFIADTSGPLAAHALRPLTILPQAIAYYLDPYSFKYWNLLLALSLIIKGASLSYLTSYISGSIKWGTIAGLLVIVYPADTMQLSFRALHINWALSFLLLSTAIFVAALQIKHRFYSYLMSAVAAILLLTACAMYEASLLLVGLPWLATFIKSGLKSLLTQLRQEKYKHLIWLAGAVSYIAYAVNAAPLVNSYQSAIAGTSIISTLIHSSPNLFSVGLLRTVFGGWYDAFLITAREFGTYWYAVSVLITISIVFFVLLPRPRQAECAPTGVSMPVRLLTAGIVIALLGYAPFLLSTSHQAMSQRTFLFASPGGVLITLAALLCLNHVSKVTGAFCVSLLIFVGLSTQLYQFHHYVKISDRQRNIIKNIVENYDGEIGTKTLLVLDKTNQLNNTWMFMNGNLQATLNYIYGHAFPLMEVCRDNGSEWQQTDSVGRKGTCEETSDEWVLHYPTSISGPGFEPTQPPPDKEISKSAIVSLVINPDVKTQVRSTRVDMLRHEQSRTGAIYRGFVDKPNYHNAMISFTDQKPSERYFWGFGNWWSMELPIAGSGWREAEWTVNKLHHNASAWKTNEQAYLNFNFAPSPVNYRLNGRFDTIVNSSIMKSIKVEMNGVNLPIRWHDANNFEAIISKDLLTTGLNTIGFKSDVDVGYYGFSGRLDWIEIKKDD